VVHFTVNDRAFAERSVDARMAREMTAGASCLGGDAAAVAAVNQGASPRLNEIVSQGVVELS
jgi:hypothetical protein